MAMTEKSKKVFTFLHDHPEGNYTAADVAEQIGFEKRSVDGVFTSLCKKGLGERVPAEREEDDGTHTKINLLKLTAEGLEFDPSAEAE